MSAYHGSRPFRGREPIGDCFAIPWTCGGSVRFRRSAEEEGTVGGFDDSGFEYADDRLGSVAVRVGRQVSKDRAAGELFAALVIRFLFLAGFELNFLDPFRQVDLLAAQGF
jgi:hypothetical protein